MIYQIHHGRGRIETTTDTERAETLSKRGRRVTAREEP